jgi:hypothetical protein
MTELKFPKGPLIQAELTSYADVIAAWDKVKFGGIIVCETPGKAVNLRQRMYKIRKRMQKTQGATQWDDMTVSLEYGDNRLYIKKIGTGIIDIIPDLQEQTVEHTQEGKNEIIISKKRKAII